MALTAAQRREAWQLLVNADVSVGGFSKPQLEAAVDAVDTWCADNAASYNAALPAAFRNNATPGHKALMLAYVAMKRTGVL